LWNFFQARKSGFICT